MIGLEVVFLEKNSILSRVVDDIYFEQETPFGIVIRTTKEYWERIITIKHPSVAKFTNEVKQALREPDQVRRSKRDQQVHLYYKSLGKLWVCVVTDHLNKKEGYVITAYLTDRIKEGEPVYDKN